MGNTLRFCEYVHVVDVKMSSFLHDYILHQLPVGLITLGLRGSTAGVPAHAAVQLGSGTHH